MFGQLLFKDDGFIPQNLLKLAGPLCTIAMNSWRDGYNNEAIYGFLVTVNYDIIFFAQGLIDSFYWEKQKGTIETMSKSSVWMVLVLKAMACIISVTAPTVVKNQGFLWFYPMY